MFEHAKEKEEIVSLFSQEKRELQEEINAVVAEHNEAMIVAESEKQQELSVKESEKVKRKMADEAIFTLYVCFFVLFYFKPFTSGSTSRTIQCIDSRKQAITSLS